MPDLSYMSACLSSSSTPLSQGSSFVEHEPDPKACRVLVSSGEMEVSVWLAISESMPAAAGREAAPEADRVPTTMRRYSPPQPAMGDTTDSYAVSLDIQSGSTH